MSGIDRLSALVKRLRSVNAMRQEVSYRLAKETLGLIDDGFKRQTNPYGVRWAPIERSGKILDKTGRLKGSWVPSNVGPNGFKIVSTASYGGFQQYGTKHIAVRKMVPTEGGGLGPTWFGAYERVVNKYIRESFK